MMRRWGQSSDSSHESHQSRTFQPKPQETFVMRGAFPTRERVTDVTKPHQTLLPTAPHISSRCSHHNVLVLRRLLKWTFRRQLTTLSLSSIAPFITLSLHPFATSFVVIKWMVSCQRRRNVKTGKWRRLNTSEAAAPSTWINFIVDSLPPWWTIKKIILTLI